MLSKRMKFMAVLLFILFTLANTQGKKKGSISVEERKLQSMKDECRLTYAIMYFAISSHFHLKIVIPFDSIEFDQQISTTFLCLIYKINEIKKCGFSDTDDFLGNCINYCINKECFMSTGVALEFGEIDKEKERIFGNCVKKILREQKEK